MTCPKKAGSVFVKCSHATVNLETKATIMFVRDIYHRKPTKPPGTMHFHGRSLFFSAARRLTMHPFSEAARKASGSTIVSAPSPVLFAPDIEDA